MPMLRLRGLASVACEEANTRECRGVFRNHQTDGERHTDGEILLSSVSWHRYSNCHFIRWSVGRSRRVTGALDNNFSFFCT